MINFPRWIRVAVGLSVLLIVFSMFVPMVNRSPLNGQRAECQTNLKQIALACREYTQDYDERFPPTFTSSGQGWTELLLPYAKSEDIFHCPSNPEAMQSNQTDYFYNARLSKVEVFFPEKANQTIVFGDGYPDSGTNSNLTQLPSNWKNNKNSPGQRHLGGANYAFADGHVKWIRPEFISSLKPDKSDNSIATFALN